LALVELAVAELELALLDLELAVAVLELAVLGLAVLGLAVLEVVSQSTFSYSEPNYLHSFPQMLYLSAHSSSLLDLPFVANWCLTFEQLDSYQSATCHSHSQRLCSHRSTIEYWRNPLFAWLRLPTCLHWPVPGIQYFAMADS